MNLMAMQAFDRLHNLDKMKTEWRVRVRVTRMWPTVSPDNGIVKGFNLIMLDEDNEHVHGFAYADTWAGIGNDVEEGRVYVVNDFVVRDATGNLKPVSSRFTVRFSGATTFQPSDDTSMIPRHKFEFLDLGDLYDQAILHAPNENPEYATDVIGVVENFEKLKKIGTKFGDRDIVRFRLCDGSVRHRVAVWGDLAKIVDRDFSAELEKPVIAILTSTKLTTYKTTVQISTLPSSKVYFNLQDDSVNDMRQRLADDGYNSESYNESDINNEHYVPIFDKVAIKELVENASEKMKKHIYCKFVISKVVDDCFWWYNSCNKCQAEVVKVDKVYKCAECPRNIPVAEKRFRVKVIAKDSTSSAAVFLMDRIVKPMVFISATNLKKITDNDPKMIPDLIAGLAGKEVCAVVEVKRCSSNSNGGYLIHASDLYEVQIPSPSVTITATPPEYPTIALSDSFDQVQTSKTPGSAISVNKKIKVEK